MKYFIILMLAFLCTSCIFSKKNNSVFAPSFHPSNPVIIIPGILGTRLKDPRDGRIVWGKAFDLQAAGLHSVPFGEKKDGLELPIKFQDFSNNIDHLVPDGILDRFTVIPNVLSVKVYDKLLKSLKACGYRPGLIQKCTAGENVFVFYYDWRRDMVEHAEALHARIQYLKKVNGNPNLKIDLIAHSMGCLVVKYYLLYGGKDVLGQDSLPEPSFEGAKHIRRVVFVAPPFDGSTMALKYLHTGYKVGFQKISPQALFTMPSIFQLLPRQIRFLNDQGKPEPFDIYNPESWREMGLSVFSEEKQDQFLEECKKIFPEDWEQRSILVHDQTEVYLNRALDRAARLHKALDYSDAHTPYLILASNSSPTTDAVTVKKKGGEYELIFNHSSGMKPGDQTVLLESSLYGLRNETQYKIFPGIHDKLPSEPAVMKEMIRFLSQ